MSDKPTEGLDKMTVEYVSEVKGMAEYILSRTYRGPGDNVDAAMHRAEKLYGAPAKWLHRLRYREIREIPGSALIALTQAYSRAVAAADHAYETERARHAPDAAIARLADLIAGSKIETNEAEANTHRQ